MPEEPSDQGMRLPLAGWAGRSLKLQVAELPPRPAGEAVGGRVAEAGEDDQHTDPQLLPVPAEEGGVL